MSKWEELEKAARAATPGPWEWLGTNALWGGNQEILKAADDGKPYGMHTAIIEHHWHQETAAANRAFMESANPSTILELLEERDALKAENEFLEEMNAQLREQNDSVGAACAKYEAENERLTSCLKKANDQAEDFERRWYLADMELDRIRAKEPVAWRWSVKKLNGVEWRYTLHQTKPESEPLYTMEKP